MGFWMCGLVCLAGLEEPEGRVAQSNSKWQGVGEKGQLRKMPVLAKHGGTQCRLTVGQEEAAEGS